MRTHLNTLAPLGALAAALWASPAWAQDPVACSVQASSMIEQFLDDAAGGDTDFFVSVDAAPPNLAWVLDTSCSMRQMPSLPAVNHCSDPVYDVAAKRGCVAKTSTADPYPCPDFDPTQPSWGGWSGLFSPGVIYDTDMGCCGFSEKGLGDAASVCAGMGVDAAMCNTCLTTKGYWKQPFGRVYFDGNLLNVFPPKYVIARKAVKDLLQDRTIRPIRMGILGFDRANGARWLTPSKVNPACNQAWPPDGSAFFNNRSALSKKVEGLRAADFNDSTPLAESLFNVGQYYNFADDSYLSAGWGLFLKPGFTSATGDNQKSTCFTCQLNAVALITDGEPSGDNNVPAEIIALDGTVDPVLDCPLCGVNTLHKVAYYLANRDIRYDYVDDQTVKTYTVSFALDSPSAVDLLYRTARAGDGAFYNALNYRQLKEAMKAIAENVLDRSGSFTASNVSTIQSQATQSVLIPKFTPKKDEPWHGELFRFDFLSEFAIDYDLDGDGSKSNFYLIDDGCEGIDWDAVRAGAAIPSSCSPVREAKSTDLATNPLFTLGRFYKTNSFADPTLRLVSATPFWEAGRELVTTVADGRTYDVKGPMSRRIFTAIDTNGDGVFETVPFNDANAAAILPYLGLGGTDFCEALTVVAGGVSQTECAQALMRFVRGCELGHPTSGCKTRPTVLADIFHSAPEVMEPPTPAALLNTPFRNPQTPSLLGRNGDFPSVHSAGYISAYDEFAQRYNKRDQVAIVGSNGGMLHAFHSGGVISTDPNRMPAFNRGTGEELWAFVPTDLLPKLKYFVEFRRHPFYVDGTPWIKNIWVDGWTGPGTVGSRDYKRQPREFRTVAIFGERRGGNHTWALDVTNGHLPTYVPRVLWTFPKFGSKYESLVGQSWNDISPIPSPPIGAIRFKDAGAPTMPVRGSTWRERWVVPLSAGFDKNQGRGKGWFLFDAYTGELLWDFLYDPAHPVKRYLKYSFGSPPSMTAWGPSARRQVGQAYFDTLGLGDTGGQFWIGRFGDPDPAKWSGARLFEPEKVLSSDPNRAPWNPPFFSAPTFTMMPESGHLRAYIGTGNRMNLRDPSGGQCSAQNPMACAQSGQCSDVGLSYHGLDYGHSSLTSGVYVPATGEMQAASILGAGSGGGACPDISAKTAFGVRACTHIDGTTIPDYLRHQHQSCVYDAPTSSYVCNTDELATDEVTILPEEPIVPPLHCTDSTNTKFSRFYSLRVFGPNLNPFDAPADAEAFDTNRLSTGVDPASEVVFVDPQSPTPLNVGSTSPGWYYQYNTVMERSATGAVTSGSCVVWSALEAMEVNPRCGVTTTTGAIANPCSGESRAQQAYMYFRNFVTGRADCLNFGDTPPPQWDAANGRMNIGRDPQPPKDPILVLSVNAKGEVSPSVTDGSGHPDVPSVTLGQGDQLLRTYGIMSVPRDVHDWRHSACQGGAQCF